MVTFINLFNDPKNIISILAVIISVASFLFTYFNQKTQNKKWDMLNAPNPEINHIRMKSWKELKRDDAVNIEWGYEPLIYEKPDTADICFLPYCLSLYDPVTNEKLSKTNHVFTYEDVEKELKRIGRQPPVAIYKLFRPEIKIENAGKTIAKNVCITVDMKFKNLEWHKVFDSISKVDLSPGPPRVVSFDFTIPVQVEYPEELLFRINITWEEKENNKKFKKIDMTWNLNKNSWTFGALIS